MAGLGTRQRLLAVLDYDSIEPCRRAAHLSAACSCSNTSARRWLSSDDAADKMTIHRLLDLAQGLDIDLLWLWTGEGETFKPRTVRIHLQQIKGFPVHEVDRMIRLFVAANAGYGKAVNLTNLVVANKLTLPAAARLM